MSDNTRICACTTQQYDPITFKNSDFQNAANTIYESKSATLANSRNGTLGNSATGNPIFKSDFERMQYLLGRQNRGISGAGCGVAKKTFAT
jgi:hypothetical protein